MNRTALSLLLGALAAGAGASPGRAAELEARIAVDSTRPRGPVNRRVLGNNIQWHNRAERLLDKAGGLAPEMLEAIARIPPTVLRFPAARTPTPSTGGAGSGPRTGGARTRASRDRARR